MPQSGDLYGGYTHRPPIQYRIFMHSRPPCCCHPVSHRYRWEQRSAEMQLNLRSTSYTSDSRSGRYRTAASREHPVIARIERISERIAEEIIAWAPLFWLALFLAFVSV